jgi:hypothetical protein
MTATVDTSRHTTECLCQSCEHNGTGQWATREVLAKYDTDEITPTMQAEIVALCESRGRAGKASDAA